jgi:hypothetical protein
MKKFALLSFLVAATTAAFGQASSSDTKTVSLSVASYVSVSIASGATITVNDGGQAGSYNIPSLIPYTVLCNVNVLGGVVVANSTLINGVLANASIDTTSFGAPGGSGLLNAGISGVTLSNSKSNDTKSFDVVVTFTEN